MRGGSDCCVISIGSETEGGGCGTLLDCELL
jgi:hypothetical protein